MKKTITLALALLLFVQVAGATNTSTNKNPVGADWKHPVIAPSLDGDQNITEDQKKKLKKLESDYDNYLLNRIADKQKRISTLGKKIKDQRTTIRNLKLVLFLFILFFVFALYALRKGE